MLQNLWVKVRSRFLALSPPAHLGVVLFLGGLASLSMPPFHYTFFLPLSFSGFLIFLEKANSAKMAFGSGWIFGFGYFVGGLYWMAHGPLTLDMWLAAPFAAIGLPLGLAFFPAIASLLTVRFSTVPVARVFAFTAFWSLMEWLRGHVLTGLPWNLLGYVWDNPLLQITSIIGIYGLTAITVFAACVFASRYKGLIVATILSLGGLWVWGDYRIDQSPHYEETQPADIHLRIVQASIPQQTKWLVERFHSNLNRYITLSREPSQKPLAAVIWPEASVTALVENGSLLSKALAEAAPPKGLVLFGSPRMVDGHLRTSMLGLDAAGNIVATYDKSHLVPFGEYMPLRSLLSFKKLTYGDRDYTPGTGVRTVSLPGLPGVSPLICYEAIFPHAVVDGKDRPYWMLNLTNDAWFGHSPGPYQHLQIVRVRAIEEGIPLVRAANNGISAVINSCGKILHRLELDVISFIDFSLPKRLNHVTFYQKWGDIPFFVMLVVFLSLSALFSQHRKRKDKIFS